MPHKDRCLSSTFGQSYSRKPHRCCCKETAKSWSLQEVEGKLIRKQRITWEETATAWNWSAIDEESSWGRPTLVPGAFLELSGLSYFGFLKRLFCARGAFREPSASARCVCAVDFLTTTSFNVLHEVVQDSPFRDDGSNHEWRSSQRTNQFAVGVF